MIVELPSANSSSICNNCFITPSVSSPCPPASRYEIVDGAIAKLSNACKFLSTTDKILCSTICACASLISIAVLIPSCRVLMTVIIIDKTNGNAARFTITAISFVLMLSLNDTFFVSCITCSLLL